MVVIRHRRAVLFLAVLFLALAGALAGGVAKELSGGGFNDPNAPSDRAARVLTSTFGGGASNLALLVRTPGPVDAPGVAAAGRALVARLSAEPGVIQVASYWTSGRPASLRSVDGRKALVLARLTGADDAAVTRVRTLAPLYRGPFQGLQVQVGGQAEVFREVGDTIEHDVIRAESIAIPVTAVLLVIVFGSAVAATLPLLVGVLSIVGTLLTLHLLVQVTPVSVYAVNLATSLGLGLGIDYSLFLLTRYREELACGRGTHNAVVETLRTAGRTVLFSALTVLLSLSAMLVFPLYFLKSFAYAGISSVLFAGASALVVLPAALAVLGHRVDSLDLRRPVRLLLGLAPLAARPPESGLWHRIAMSVMRRPVAIGVSIVALLLIAGAPFAKVVFSLPDDRVLPRSASALQVGNVLRTEFPGRDSYALAVVAPHVSDPGGAGNGLDAYARALSATPGVERVEAATGSYRQGRLSAPATATSARFTAAHATYLSVIPAVESYGPSGERLVRSLRAVPAPFAGVVIGGQAAALVDTKAALAHRLPLALGVIVLATIVVLFLFTGSVVIPAKALVLNLLSLSATFGAMVWVFQQGHLIRLLGNPVVTGTLDTTTPILMFCVLFGLSMDYEVFLLSRIKEEWEATGDNTLAVARGLERTGRLVSAAAGLLAIVFLAFLSSDITFIKLLGLGTALAVLVDATLVRGALVPAFMRLAGRANWWAPAPLRRLHQRIGIREAAGG
ncbi:MAG: MMPL family transporter [Actinomycetota bacterium]|nr:MMPL family transporter [Actinomycetota bacterium]